MIVQTTMVAMSRLAAKILTIN